MSAGLGTAWLIEEMVENILWTISTLERSLGAFTKQGAKNVGPLVENVAVTCAGYDGEHYYINIEYVMWEPWRIKFFLAQARLPVASDNENVTVTWQHATTSQTFALKDAHVSRTALLKLPAKLLKVEGEVRIGVIPVRTYFEIPAQLWVEMEEHAAALQAIALCNKVEALRKKAEDELEALLRLWQRWHSDEEPTCKLLPEIQARYAAYRAAAEEWRKAFGDAVNFIRTRLPKLILPKDTYGLVEVLPPERWPPRTKLESTIRSLVSQAETIAASVGPLVNDLMEKYTATRARIEAIAKEAVADITTLRRRGAMVEDIEAVKAKAKALIIEERRKFAREAETTMNSLRTILNQLQQLAERIVYLSCYGAQPQEYIITQAPAPAPAPAQAPAPAPEATQAPAPAPEATPEATPPRAMRKPTIEIL